MRKRIIILLVSLDLLIVSILVTPFIIPVEDGGIDPRQLAAPDGDFVTLQNVNIYYVDKGERDAPVILLIHGLYGSTTSWRYNIDEWVDAGYRVIAYDRPAFGLSDKIENYDYSLDNQVALTAQLLAELEVSETAVLGHSAGAKVAAQFARQYPQQVTKLILADALTAVGGPPAFVGGLVEFPPVWRWARIGLQSYFTRENLEQSLGNFYGDPSFLTKADYDAYWQAFQTPGWDIGLLALTRDGAGERLTEAELRQIETKTLLIWGEQDQTIPLAQGEALAQLIPNSTLIVIPQAGHQPFEEKPEVFNQAVLAFLRE